MAGPLPPGASPHSSATHRPLRHLGHPESGLCCRAAAGGASGPRDDRGRGRRSLWFAGPARSSPSPLMRRRPVAPPLDPRHSGRSHGLTEPGALGRNGGRKPVPAAAESGEPPDRRPIASRRAASDRRIRIPAARSRHRYPQATYPHGFRCGNRPVRMEPDSIPPLQGRTASWSCQPAATRASGGCRAPRASQRWNRKSLFSDRSPGSGRPGHTGRNPGRP